MRHSAIVSVLAVMLVLNIGTLTSAGEDSKTERVVPEVKAYRINPHAPVIDGNLDDPVWNSPGVEIVGDFSRFFSIGSSNVFPVKASYWLNI